MVEKGKQVMEAVLENRKPGLEAMRQMGLSAGRNTQAVKHAFKIALN